MAKNIIVFSDGTSNTKATNTNVRQFFTALDGHEDNECFYDRGVGSFFGDVLGKAFGAGVGDNIKQCYQFIVQNYEAGDRLFLFGFSRGAYTVRSLASFLTMIGLVAEQDNRSRRRGNRKIASPQTRAIRKAYNVYRANKTPIFKDGLASLKVKQEMLECQVYGIGVWDTVGAIGLPNFDKDHAAYGEHYYHRTKLPKNVAHAYHALAIDDERHNFAPVLFNKQPRNASNIEEVWFAGMHSDVGGGYRLSDRDPHAKELSNISLKWMADKFSGELTFDRSQFGRPKPKGYMHDSRTGAAEKLYKKKVRTVPQGSHIHQSVVKRMTGTLPNPSPTREPDRVYRPAALRQLDYDLGPNFGLETLYKLV